MKKIVSIISAITMLCAFSTTAFAADLPDSGELGLGSDSHNVVAKYNSGITTPDVYSVDVKWGAMEFTYNVGGAREWNADNHSYSDRSSANWEPSGNTVTVTNHSNKAVTASFGFVKDNGVIENIAGDFSVDSEQLDAGTVGGYDSADNVTSTLTISGELDSAKTTFTKIGTVTVTVE